MTTTIMILAMVGCADKPPPDSRAIVTAAVYDKGDAVRGKQLYEDNCLECHKLQPGRNSKGPQLLGVYGAPAGALADYDYTSAMTNSGWTWDATTLDTYLADAEKALPDTRMYVDPIPDERVRHDIIAYLSTLGRDAQPVAQQDAQ